MELSADSLPQGRERFFHGTNVVYKSAPFLPVVDRFDALTSFSVEDADLLQSMGFNTIRLGVLWAGLEPVQGQYNVTYLDQVHHSVLIILPINANKCRIFYTFSII